MRVAEEQKATSGRILPRGKRPGASRLRFTARRCRAGHMAAGGGAWGFGPCPELTAAPALVPLSLLRPGTTAGVCHAAGRGWLAGVHSHVVTPPQQEEMGWKGWIFLPSPPGQPPGRLGRGRVPAASAAHAYPHKRPDRLGDLT